MAATDEVVTLGCDHYPNLSITVGDETVQFEDGEATVSPAVAGKVVGPVDEYGEIVEKSRGKAPAKPRGRKKRGDVPPPDGHGRVDQATTAVPTGPLPDEIENGDGGSVNTAPPIDGAGQTGTASTSKGGTDGAEAVGDDPESPTVPNAPSGDALDTTDAGDVGPTA